MKQLKIKLQSLYLDWLNNFISLGAFADYYHISDERALRIITTGRIVHEKLVATI